VQLGRLRLKSQLSLVLNGQLAHLAFGDYQRQTFGPTFLQANPEPTGRPCAYLLRLFRAARSCSVD
jgi:hypothetical protein